MTQIESSASTDAIGSGGDGRATRVMAPINIGKWVEENRHLLKPPVGNKYLYDGKDFFVMVIGGPNARNDFHMTDSEEYFYQYKGDMVVTVRDDLGLRHIPVREGETLFLPGGVPHSPQRQPGTIGIVVERRRPVGEIEHLQFYCPKCSELVYDKAFDCDDIVEHFSRAMEEFWADPVLSTCRCGYKIDKAKPISRIVFEPEIVIEREA